MLKSLKSSSILITVLLCGAPASAQEIHFKQICQDVGGEDFSKFDDKAGHGVASGTYSCRVDGGPMDGALVTGTSISEWEKTEGVSLSGNAVVRKPGGYAVYQDVEGTTSLTITDGKISGATGKGSVHYVFATGAAAPLAGKTVVYTIKTTGPAEWIADATVQ